MDWSWDWKLSEIAGLPLGEVALRLSVAVVCGIVLGLEREEHGRAAGLKTTLFACVSATIAMILSESLYLREGGHNGWKPDPARLAQGILTGMGFLGAGAIIRQGNAVRGITTAAILWFITILGLCFGSGHIWLGLTGWALALLALWVLPAVEGHIKKDWYGTVLVKSRMPGPTDAEVKTALEKLDLKVVRVDLDYDLNGQTKALQCELKMRRGDIFGISQQVVKALLVLPGITQVVWGTPLGGKSP